MLGQTKIICQEQTLQLTLLEDEWLRTKTFYNIDTWGLYYKTCNLRKIDKFRNKLESSIVRHKYVTLITHQLNTKSINYETIIFIVPSPGANVINSFVRNLRVFKLRSSVCPLAGFTSIVYCLPQIFQLFCYSLWLTK